MIATFSRIPSPVPCEIPGEPASGNADPVRGIATDSPTGAAPTQAGAAPSLGCGPSTTNDQPSTRAAGEAIARAEGLRFSCEDWPIADFPDVGFIMAKRWVFTDPDPRSLSYGITCYFGPGATLEEVRRRFEEKREEALCPMASGAATA